jgi:triosephosphate isomerase
MNLGCVDEALAFVHRIRYPLNGIEGVERVLCPPFTVLASVAEILRPTRIRLGTQTMHWEDRETYTGEIPLAMLAELCQYVILGHSERRKGRDFHPQRRAVGQRQEPLRHCAQKSRLLRLQAS